MNDFNIIASRVKDRIPEVNVHQMHKTHPGDDDGLWWFRLPDVKKDIQIESSTCNCPFLIEHDDMASREEAITTETVETTVDVLVEYLIRIRPKH